jgi:hypothetical protein
MPRKKRRTDSPVTPSPLVCEECGRGLVEADRQPDGDGMRVTYVYAVAPSEVEPWPGTRHQERWRQSTTHTRFSSRTRRYDAEGRLRAEPIAITYRCVRPHLA